MGPQCSQTPSHPGRAVRKGLRDRPSHIEKGLAPQPGAAGQQPLPRPQQAGGPLRDPAGGLWAPGGKQGTRRRWEEGTSQAAPTRSPGRHLAQLLGRLKPVRVAEATARSRGWGTGLGLPPRLGCLRPPGSSGHFPVLNLGGCINSLQLAFSARSDMSLVKLSQPKP